MPVEQPVMSARVTGTSSSNVRPYPGDRASASRRVARCRPWVAGARQLREADHIGGERGHVVEMTESFWPADQSVALRNLTVGDLLREAAKDSPDSIGLVAGVPGVDRRWTFTEMLAEAEQVAAALLVRFTPGERVAVWAPNLPEWLLLEFGAGLAGVVLVTVNPACQRHELAYVLGQSGASGVFLVRAWRGNPMLASLPAGRGEVAPFRDVVLVQDG